MIEILNGSPRKNGNTAYLCGRFAESMQEASHPTNITFLNSIKIKPCIDCRGCKKGGLVCVVKDDMQTLYDRMNKADILLFATPIYWYGPTAQTKLLIDRLRPYYGNKQLKGKKAALILPAGSGEIDCDLTLQMFNRIFNLLGIEYLGAVTCKAYELGEAEQDAAALAAVEKLSEKVIKAL